MAIRGLETRDAQALVDVQVRNRAFLTPWDPAREPGFFTLAGQREVIVRSHEAARQDLAYGFAILERTTGDLVGRVNVSNVVRGAWHNCTIGYFVDEARNGRGYATEAVCLAVGFAFARAGLHRVQAAVMPRNVRSIRVVEKAGFRFEGLARSYLQIDGVWEDHGIYAVTVEEWTSRPSPGEA